MVKLKVNPSELQGGVALPPSKSQTLRALVFGSMGKGETQIENYLKSPDTHSMIKAFRLLGVPIHVEDDRILIEGVNGRLLPSEDVIDAGNSGLVLRFVGCLAALLPTYTILTGDDSIRHSRPVKPMLSAIEQLEGFATSSRLDDRAPIIIKGPIKSGKAILDGQDSQPVSGLLIAASFLSGTTELQVNHPGEKPWIDLTLLWLNKLGAKVTHRNYESYSITGPLTYPGFRFRVPGDYSSAAFLIVAALITHSQITLENIDLQESYGDRKIIDVLTLMGAQFESDHFNKTLTVMRSPILTGMKIDANDIIDAVPILAVLGCFAKGKTKIVNAAIARKKESDRIYAITTELRKMGAWIEEKEDGFIISHSKLKGCVTFSHADHRIAMSLAVAALKADGTTYIEGIECIEKSYPSFMGDFQRLGASMTLTEQERVHCGKQ